MTRGGRWEWYQRLVDERPVLAQVNVGVLGGEPDAGRPFIVRADAAIRDADAEGLPGKAEFARLESLGERLMAAAARVGAPECLGVLTGRGRRSWYFGVATSPALQEALREAARWAGSEVEVSATRDPGWKVLEEELLPSPEEIRWNADMSVIAQLEEAGDDMASPRPIVHYAYFPSGDARREFVGWLEESGFAVEGMIEPGEQNALPGVKFSHVGVPEIGEVFERTSGAAIEAEKCGGEYDGWETAVVRAR